MNPNQHQRFMNKIIKTGNCWEWIGAKQSGGYGSFGIYCEMKLAHRLSYEHWIGKIPEGLQIDHLCRVRHCVNPDHLEPVTNKENVIRGNAGKHDNSFNKTKTHCKHGHEFTPENTYRRPRGSRECRTCGRINGRNRHLNLGDLKNKT